MTHERAKTHIQRTELIGKLSPGWNFGGFDRSSPKVQDLLMVAAIRTLNGLTKEEIRLLEEGWYEEKIPIRDKFFNNFSQILNGDET